MLYSKLRAKSVPAEFGADLCAGSRRESANRVARVGSLREIGATKLCVPSLAKRGRDRVGAAAFACTVRESPHPVLPPLRKGRDAGAERIQIRQCVSRQDATAHSNPGSRSPINCSARP